MAEYVQAAPKAHPGTDDAGLCTRCALKPAGPDYSEKDNECPPGFWTANRLVLNLDRLGGIADFVDSQGGVPAHNDAEWLRAFIIQERYRRQDNG